MIAKRPLAEPFRRCCCSRWCRFGFDQTGATKPKHDRPNLTKTGAPAIRIHELFGSHAGFGTHPMTRLHSCQVKVDSGEHKAHPYRLVKTTSSDGRSLGSLDLAYMWSPLFTERRKLHEDWSRLVTG